MISTKGALSLLEPLRPSFWFGPIFDKELRVTARRRRHYVLRMVYGLLLMVMTVSVWVQVVPRISPDEWTTSRMAQAGKAIVTLLAWFQFIGLQLVTVVTMSSAISEEITRRTLSTLMTTPITSVQIVLGKLFSRLLQVMLLYAMSWPLLAMVRVFGGVPWNYLLSTACMTLSLVWFLSSLTLLYSVFFKRAYTVMIFAVMTAGVLFGLVPLLLMYVIEASPSLRGQPALLTIGRSTLATICPYLGFWCQTQAMQTTGVPGWSFSWPVHCILMLSLSVPLLWLACVKVRKAALRHLVARTSRKEYKIPKNVGRREILYRPLFLHNWIRRRWGTGMVWKEFLVPVLGRFRFVVYVAAGALFGVFGIGLTLAIFLERLELLGFLFALLIFSFLLLAILFTLVVPATCITSEKEARCWSILLTTRMSHGQILGGKLAGVLRRIVLAWSPFCVIFGLVAYTLGMPLPLLIQLSGVGIISVGFLVAVGLYLSTRFQRSTPAVVTGFTLLGIIWGLVPLMATVLQAFSYQWSWVRHSIRSWHMVETIMNATPVGMIVTLLNYPSRNVWQLGNARSALVFHASLYVALYGGGALFLLWRAKANIARHA